MFYIIASQHKPRNKKKDQKFVSRTSISLNLSRYCFHCCFEDKIKIQHYGNKRILVITMQLTSAGLFLKKTTPHKLRSTACNFVSILIYPASGYGDNSRNRTGPEGPNWGREPPNGGQGSIQKCP